MAEVFNNYLYKGTVGKNTTITVIPRSGGNISQPGKGVRTINSVSQIHSLYLSIESNTKITNIEDNGLFVNIVINNSDGTKVHIANNVCILPHAPFYIEKTITLLSHQSLEIEGATTNNSVTKTLHCVASCVELSD